MSKTIREGRVMDRFERVRHIRGELPELFSSSEALIMLDEDMDYAFDVAYTEHA